MSTVNVVRLMTAGMLLCFLGIFGCPNQAKAAGTCPVGHTYLNVGVSVFEPMVVKNPNGSFSGFEIELFEAAVKDIGCGILYKEYTDFPKLLKEVGEGKIDVALGGISITASREMGGIDFTHSFYDSGIAVLVRQEVSGSTFIETFKQLLHSPAPRHMAWLLIYGAIMANLIWWLMREHVEIADTYFRGVFDAFYYALTTSWTVGYGDIASREFWGRSVALILMVTGIPMTGLLSGDIISFAQSDAHNRYSIESLEDLGGKKIATLGGTTSVEAVKNRVASVDLVESVEEGYRLLQDKKIDGVVFDLPPLKHYSVRSGGSVTVLPDLLSKEKYGIALPDNTRLRESINGRVLTFKEDGRYQKIYKEYFDGR